MFSDILKIPTRCSASLAPGGKRSWSGIQILYLLLRMPEMEGIAADRHCSLAGDDHTSVQGSATSKDRRGRESYLGKVTAVFALAFCSSFVGPSIGVGVHRMLPGEQRVEVKVKALLREVEGKIGLAGVASAQVI